VDHGRREDGRRQGALGEEAWQGSEEISIQPFGLTIDSIDAKALLIEETTPRIENARYVAFYNWVDGTDPVVLLPGKSSSQGAQSVLEIRELGIAA
jgi:hypothetical protein